MNVIARSGRQAFLIGLNDGRAAVLSIEAEPTLSAPLAPESVLSRGYWEEFGGDQDLVLDLVQRIREEGEERPSLGWDSEPSWRLAGLHVGAEELERAFVDVPLGSRVGSGRTFVVAGEFGWARSRMPLSS